MAEIANDEAGPVRSGEELDTRALARFLGEAGFRGDVRVEQFPGGYSNLTYLIHVGEVELVLRRPPAGSTVRSAHDMGREYRLLSALAGTSVPVPRSVAYCPDDSVLGAPFYLMERVRGVILRAQGPPGLVVVGESWRRLSEEFVDRLVALHAVDFEAVGLADLGRPEGYAERQVRGWAKRYADARTDDLPSVERARDWLEAHVPAAAGAVLLHNDYKYDNLVLDSRDEGGNPRLHIRAILDWEMATLGDPLLDLGTALAYWLDPDDPESWRRCALSDLTARPGNLSRAQIVERYAAATGRDPSGALFAYVCGLFKLAVIVQQIYARYRKGLTSDRRFAGLLPVVAACGDQACRAIDRRRVDRLGEGGENRA